MATKDKKLEKFKNLIFEEFGQHESYDKVLHRLLQSREHMIKHAPFRHTTVKTQLNMLCTIDLMVTHTQLAEMNRSRPISKPKDIEYKYDIEKGFNKPQYVESKIRMQFLIDDEKPETT